MIIDVVVVIVLLFSAAVSFWRGLIREVLTIAGIVGGLVASYVAGPLLIPQMRLWFGVVEGAEPQKLGPITYEMAADVTSYLTIFIVVIFVLSIISHFISEFVRNIGLGALDRSLGVIFGLARGILLLGVIYLPFSYLLTDEMKEQYLVPAKSYVYLEGVSQALMVYMPGEVEQALTEAATKAEEAGTMHQQLEGMGLLNDGTDQKQDEKNPEGTENTKDVGAEQENDVTTQKKPSGYTEEFRDNMNQLIEKNLKPEPQKNKQQ